MQLLPCPLPSDRGATITEDGVTFAVFSAHGEQAWLCIFDETGDREIARLRFPSRTGDVHHGFMPGAGAGLRYGLRMDGPWQPERGHRFDATKLLVDPYALAIDRPYRHRLELTLPPSANVDTAAMVPKAVVRVPPDAARFEGAVASAPLIYEMNVRGFSMLHPGVAPEWRGTVRALAEPAVIAHLKRIGVTHVELMPIAAWMDERHLGPLGLTNAWGYNPVTFMTLDPRLAPGGWSDLKHATDALHDAGLRVLVDVVYNHTAESDEFGATVSLRGLDNAVYYRHTRHDAGMLVNDTGCGNTLALDQPEPLRLVMDSLRHWAACGIDGFRFDLGPVLGRTSDGFTPDAPLMQSMLQDPLLRRLDLISEPWDIGPGGYQLGNFPAPFKEWNDHYRDDIRKFWRGDSGMAGALATRLSGSADIFERSRRPPSAGINFVAAHDGMTLADVVAYAHKHNEANGENNRDGTDANQSANWGVEGATSDAAIRQTRASLVRAMLATLFFSRGTPMLLAGDELGRTQQGNNNSYAQDNAINWIDWAGADADLTAFVEQLAQARQAMAQATCDAYFTGANTAQNEHDVLWRNMSGEEMTGRDWSSAQSLMMHLGADGEAVAHLIAFSNSPHSETMVLPDGDWRVVLATVPTSVVISAQLLVPARSVTVLRKVA